MRRKEPYPWGIDRPADPCKVYPLNPSQSIDDQIDQILWRLDGEGDSIITVWLPDNLTGRMLDKVAGIPVNYTRFILGREIWLEQEVI